MTAVQSDIVLVSLLSLHEEMYMHEITKKYARVESSSAPTSCEIRQSTAAAGLGTFASRDLIAGEILYAELPFLVAKPHAMNDDMNDSGTTLSPPAKLCDDLSAISIQHNGLPSCIKLGTVQSSGALSIPV